MQILLFIYFSFIYLFIGGGGSKQVNVYSNW
jgi:hypothetical protein